MFVSGYYITLNEFDKSLIAETTASNRQNAFFRAKSGVMGRTTSGPYTSVVVDGGNIAGALDPAGSYKISVTGCFDCTVTNFESLRADDSIAATTSTQELCSEFATIDAYTDPAQPSCSVVTENTNTLQISATQNALDLNVATFEIQRTDVSIPLATLSSTQFPYSDSLDTIPGTEYVYNVYAYYAGQKSVAATCVGCTQPRPPINGVGRAFTDTVLEISWDSPVLASVSDCKCQLKIYFDNIIIEFFR